MLIIFPCIYQRKVLDMLTIDHWMPINQADRSILINRDLGIVYFSIPKCGCSSIRIFLRTVMGENIDVVRSNPHSYPLPSNLWVTFSELGGIDILKDLIAKPNVFAFSVIRDPRDRILSAYLDKFGASSSDSNVLLFGSQLLNYMGPISNDEILSLCRRMSFLEFLEHVQCAVSDAAMNEHWRPYTNQLLGLSMDSPCNINIFDINHTSTVFSRISDLFPGRYHPGLNFIFAPHKTNSKVSRDTYYNIPETRLVEKIYDLDFCLYSKLSATGATKL